jgi:threonine dehydrogenase-like Zn-dependent dehydrogenase
MYGAGDVRIETVPDARVIEPTDALVVVTRACICGSDLWPYNQLEPHETGQRMGHEFIGVVEAVGSDVRTVKTGDVVVAPFAWSDVVSERSDEAVERVRELTYGFGAHSVLECVGYEQSTVTALGIARPGGAVGRVGLPQREAIPTTLTTFFDNVTVGGGPAPARAYIEELLPDVLEGRIEPGRVLDRVTNLNGVPDGYHAMNEREAIKVMIEL